MCVSRIGPSPLNEYLTPAVLSMALFDLLECGVGIGFQWVTL